MRLRSVPLSELRIDDERAFSHVAMYDELKRVLRRDDYRFRVPERGAAPLAWDRALFLNLTFWSPEEQGDVLVADVLPADVLMHAAWHHLTARALAVAPASRGGLLLGESIASAFDIYLVGRLLGRAGAAEDAEFLASQVPRMHEVAVDAGLSDDAFEALLGEVAREPERAFDELWALLFDASTRLCRAASVEGALEVLAAFEAHRFHPLLHHFEVSNWILAARALAPDEADLEPNVGAIAAALRRGDALAWLERTWLA